MTFADLFNIQDSGLKEALAEVCADKSVGHMLSGKAVSRAIWGHGLVYMGFQSLIMSEVFGIDICRQRRDANENIELVADSETQKSSNEADERAPYDNVDFIDQQSEVGYENVDDESHDIEMLVDESYEQKESKTLDDDIKRALNLFDSIITGDISI